jgi:L-fuconolactonase
VAVDGVYLQAGTIVNLIDAHHHFWYYNQEEYGWIDESMSVLRRDYLPGDLEQELLKAGITGTLVVQARQSLQETRWLLDLAGKHRFILGVVGWLDLCSPELDIQLRELASHQELVGVRHVVQDEPDDGFMLRKEFLNGIAQLEPYNLVYDLLVYPGHLEIAARLAEKFPLQRFVLDHLGKPAIRSGEMEPWISGIEQLAKCPNVWCKISGMVTEADPEHWSYGDLHPYMEVALNAFGPGRLMLGSDWPVCRLAAGYSEVMGIGKKLTEPMKMEDRDKICYQNAADCYQLNTQLNGEAKIQGT